MPAELPIGYQAVHVLIKGRVQGVWYRAWTTERALALGVEGWVRNLASGDVEGVYVGSAETVEALIADCRGGPPLARVIEIEQQAYPVADALALLGQGFQSLSSA